MNKNKVNKISKVITLTVAMSIISVIPAFAVNKTSIRLEGKNRFLTSTAIANKVKVENLKSVVLAYGLDFPDALSGSVLASKTNSPILLLNSSVEKSTVTFDFIDKNLPKDGEIYLLGGEGVVKNEIINHLKSLGYSNFKRLGGQNRYATNLLINDELNVKKGTPVAIASSSGFADAMSISGVAGSKQMPIYLVGSDIAPEAISKIKDIEPSTIYIAGGTGVVNTKIENALKNITSNIVRFDGKDRYETSLKIANYFTKTTDTVLVANASNFPDALGGSVLATKENAPILLVPNKGNVSNQRAFIDKKNITNVITVGGTAVVSQQVVNDLTQDKPVAPPVKRSLSPSEIEQRLPGLGLTYDAENSGFFKVYRSQSEYTVVCCSDNSVSITLKANNATEASITKAVLNMALPTSGNEVYNIVTKPFNTQTIQRDGKTVELALLNCPVIKIYY